MLYRNPPNVVMAMFEKAKSISGGDGTVNPQPENPQQDGIMRPTATQEARVVSKLDWNVMTLFFVLCKCETP